jgi:cobalt-zinc-cadmium efflux system membrane fusion protein
MKSISIYTLLISFFVFIQCKKEEAPKAGKKPPERRKCSDFNRCTVKKCTDRNNNTFVTKYRFNPEIKRNDRCSAAKSGFSKHSAWRLSEIQQSSSGNAGFQGQVIAVIENPQFIQLQQDYLMARSKAHFAELDYNRQKTLNQSQASSDKAMQLAQSEMNSQRILMNSLAQQLRLININPESLKSGSITKSVPVYSSINGFVSKVNVNIGKYVNPSDVLFELINPDDIHLNLKVYEKDLENLKKDSVLQHIPMQIRAKNIMGNPSHQQRYQSGRFGGSSLPF